MSQTTEAPEKTYLVPKSGEHIFDIARKEGYDVAELLIHNNRNPKDPTQYTIEGGVILHLPYTKSSPKDDILTVEIWGSYKVFYINKMEGSRKYAFGNAKTWKDIQPFGVTNRRFKTFRIRGIATLKFSEDRIYQYYIDDMDIAPDNTPKNYGFPKEFMTEGESPEPPAKNPSVEEISTLLESVGDSVGAAEPPVTDPEPITPVFNTKVPIPALKPVGSAWKATWAPLPDGPAYFSTKLACDVEDHGGVRPTKYHFYGRIKIAGTFIKDDVEYGRPEQSVTASIPNWYGIPWDNLDDENPLPEIDTKDGADYEVTEPSKARRIVYGEQLFQYAVGKPLAQTVKAYDYAKNKVITKTRKII